MDARLAPIYFPALALSVWSHPTTDYGATQGLTVGLKRSSKRSSTGIAHIFDPTFAQRELQGMVAKYAMAPQFLSGIGLNPDTHPDTGYPPFNDTAIVNYPFNKTASTHDIGVAATTPETDGSIIGLQIMHLTDYVSGNMDIEYHGPLGFGTPAQTLTVDVDTGSADLWVPVNCRSCSSAQFFSKSSSTFHGTKKRMTITYGSGKVSGTLAHDTVSVGSLTVPQQDFIAVNNESEDFMSAPNDGLIGMAFGSIASSQKPTLFENLLREHKLSAGIFSVYLTRGVQEGSQVCFGCYDVTKTTGPVQWFPLVSRAYWAIDMNRLSSDATHSLNVDLIAAIDTGTTLIYVPNDVASSFYAMIPGAKNAAIQFGDGFYTFPCSSSLAVSLSFSGRSFAINMNDFNLGRVSAGSHDCVGGILGIGGGFPSNLAIIGDEFLKSWYSAYDYVGSRVGFAPSINNA